MELTVNEKIGLKRVEIQRVLADLAIQEAVNDLFVIKSVDPEKYRFDFQTMTFVEKPVEIK